MFLLLDHYGISVYILFLEHTYQLHGGGWRHLSDSLCAFETQLCLFLPPTAMLPYVTFRQFQSL